MVAATPINIPRSNKTASIGSTPKFPSPSGNYLPPLCGYYYHSRFSSGERKARLWPPVGKTNPATKLSACSADTDNALSPTSSAKNCTNLATPKHTLTLLLLLKPQLAKYMLSQRASERANAGQRFISSAWHIPQAKRQDRHQLSVVSQSVSQSVSLSARGVVPVRRDVVFVHHAWTIPDALCDAAAAAGRAAAILCASSSRHRLR